MARRFTLAFLILPIALSAADGRKSFRDRCAGCHGSDARGSGKGPGLEGNPRLGGKSVAELRAIVQAGFPDAGMPPFDLPAEPAVFAPGPEPEEIAEIAAKLRKAAGLPKEPTGIVANNASNGAKKNKPKVG